MSLTVRLILILFGLAYLISPVDIIPDLALPFVGWIDDGLVLWCIYHLLRTGDLPWFLFKRPGSPTAFPGGRQSRPRGRTHPGSRNSDSQQKTGQTRNRSGRNRSGQPHGKSRQEAGQQTGNQTSQQGSKKTGQQANQKPGRQTAASPDKTPWQVLGIEQHASWSEIQRAYKEKIKQYHPDKLSHLGDEFSSLANEKFLEIQAAYEQLKSGRKKK